MRIIRSITVMQKTAIALKAKGKSIGFVPTMGALHEGHLSLIRQARKDHDMTVVSIFVNPIQFGPKEDFHRYPRPLQQDVRLCLKQGVDYLFYPKARDMYRPGFKTFIEVEGLGDLLCGARRKGHFRGVATIVCKLFNIVLPDAAYFGQKDCQQAVIIKQMVKDLDMPVSIRVEPIVRDKDGLALSSRNIYLNESQRNDALTLSRGLREAKAIIKSGEKDSRVIAKKIRDCLASAKNSQIEYISIVDLQNLTPVKKISGKCLIALAVNVGKTRLIDNIIVRPN